jgi:uncharacterized protein YbjQ (UPF0145 family)
MQDDPQYPQQPPQQPADPQSQPQYAPQQPQYPGYPPQQGQPHYAPQQSYPQQGQYPPQYQGAPQPGQPGQYPPQYQAAPQQASQQGRGNQQPTPQVANFDHTLVTTAFELPTHTVVRNYGVVRGIMVRSNSVVGSFGAGIQQMFGGNISIYTEMCERARQDTYEIMIQHAAMLGANGIIGVRYDATEISQGVTEVLCYGTAVTVVPR